jgi:hypothetical protein
LEVLAELFSVELGAPNFELSWLEVLLDCATDIAAPSKTTAAA